MVSSSFLIIRSLQLKKIMTTYTGPLNMCTQTCRLPATLRPVTHYCSPTCMTSYPLISSQATFCAMTVTFCRRLNWGLLASCLETYTGRLGFGVRDELLPLVRMGSEVRTGHLGQV